ncbi:S-layer homology domain-containing protein [Feifania hominis]|uniref:S-layer homology domain-containing protein n=1 Tax=Feifania hominis TaxID=2763660 RepID=A0A926HTF0_9FIRM|nr:S-layer homology domain-containing protein [Feifania hominis]MBC8535804.1 S-layer homology domain-containing protein [Feifania hominis]
MKRFLSCALSLILLVSLLAGVPALPVYADDILEGGDLVLSEVSHSSAKTEVDASQSVELTLTVGYTFQGTVDLVQGISIHYDKAKYPHAIAQFPDGSVAEVGGAAVRMRVVYQKKDDNNLYWTDYTIRVIRAEQSTATFTGSIKKSLTAPASVTITADEFTSRYQKNDEGELYSLVIEGVNPSFGTLKYGGRNYEYGTSFRLADLKSSPLTFTASDGGDVSYLVSGYTREEPEKPVGTIILQIVASAASTENITLQTKYDTPVSLTAAPFETVCKKVLDEELSHVMFTLPSTSYGKLYTGYTSAAKPGTAVAEDREYYRGKSPELSSVSFVPKSGYSGTVTINYTGVGVEGHSFTGKLLIEVSKRSQTIVSYATNDKTPQTFSSTDFNTVCSYEKGKTLSHVVFTLPSSSYGKLYYSYSSPSDTGTAVSNKTKYYRSGSPNLSDITFVPKEGYSGTVLISYTGYDVDGGSYSGQVEIVVSKTEEQTLSYYMEQGGVLTLSSDDLNSASKSATGSNLSYVKFTLPSSSYGKLYYDYSVNGNYDSAVSSSTKYYRSSSPYLSAVSFVPKSTFTGSVTLTYTGTSTGGYSFTGKIKVYVGKPVKYQTGSGSSVAFDSADFNAACKNATGRTLNYVKFTLPSKSSGTLYYDFTSLSQYGSKVSSSTKYYRSSSPYLSSVSFVPAEGYSGTVSISYTGYDSEGYSFTGKVAVEVTQPRDSSRYFRDVTKSHKWAVEAIDNLYEEKIVGGVGDSTFQPQSNITRGDFILMLSRAFDFKGTSSNPFRDVPRNSYYYDAITAAKVLGIAQGSDGYFRPGDPLTREDAMVLVMRTLDTYDRSLTKGSYSNLSGFVDRSDISSYAMESVATLVRAELIQGDGDTINPKGRMTRAEMAVLLYRVIKY